MQTERKRQSQISYLKKANIVKFELTKCKKKKLPEAFYLR